MPRTICWSSRLPQKYTDYLFLTWANEIYGCSFEWVSHFVLVQIALLPCLWPFGCCTSYAAANPIFHIFLVGVLVKLLSKFGNCLSNSMISPPDIRSWMLCNFSGMPDLSATICGSSILPFSDSDTQYRVSWSMRESHCDHKIFSSLDWSEMSTHPGRASCSLVRKIVPT